MLELFKFIERRAKYEYWCIAELGQAIKLWYCSRTEEALYFKMRGLIFEQ